MSRPYAKLARPGHLALGAFVAILSLTGTAQAQELRIGAGYAPHGPEKGASVVVEYLFPPVRALDLVGSPRPYASTQLSLALAFEGLTARESGQRMHCTERTVNYHIANAMAKLKVDSKLAAIQRACWLGAI